MLQGISIQENIVDFYTAIKDGNFAVVNRFLESDIVKDNIASNDIAVSRMLFALSKNKNLVVLNRLLELRMVQDNIAANYNQVFYCAYYNGNNDVVNRLLDFRAVRLELLQSEANIDESVLAIAREKEKLMLCKIAEPSDVCVFGVSKKRRREESLNDLEQIAPSSKKSRHCLKIEIEHSASKKRTREEQHDDLDQENPRKRQKIEIDALMVQDNTLRFSQTKSSDSGAPHPSVIEDFEHLWLDASDAPQSLTTPKIRF
ncbi:hypothetical protein CC99x_005985 [Candidatus Berkiella cookevillensis]|uniref:Ankyrin repeats (3 copies) n=1 Tax=Candidatus Berkiella cookevillensis TaxID=437022 RepID=A0A0Q9YHC9_9GAMM|nr:hypothetical protein [Candidatus Berkiella cookevillensis]MCS5708454.1 hypothetical protein [Candidatus Berkiella cookevillensis]